MNTELWHADITITDDLVIRCLQNQFPNLLPITNIIPLGEGWDNKVFLINEKIIFRFPRREVAVKLITRENAVLENIAPLVNISIPNLLYRGHPSTDYPYEFHGYSLIPGLSASHAKLSDSVRLESLPVLANFLKQLHTIDETQAKAIGAQPQVFNRIVISEITEALIERVDKIAAQKICFINKALFDEEIHKAQNIKLSLKNKSLVHGDLDSRHLIMQDGKLTGIIDWGDVGINHRAVDLAIIWSFYPKEAHHLFFEIYGKVDDATWQYARFLSLYSALTLLLYAHSVGDALLVCEKRETIARIAPKLLMHSRISD